MQKEYHTSTHMLLHRCRFYVYRMSCTDGTKFKHETSTYESKTQKSPYSVVNIFGVSVKNENTYNRFKVMEAIPFMYQINNYSVKIELVVILEVCHLSKRHNSVCSRNGYDSFSLHTDK